VLTLSRIGSAFGNWASAAPNSGMSSYVMKPVRGRVPYSGVVSRSGFCVVVIACGRCGDPLAVPSSVALRVHHRVTTCYCATCSELMLSSEQADSADG
jgi:hypothetical protein